MVERVDTWYQHRVRVGLLDEGGRRREESRRERARGQVCRGGEETLPEYAREITGAVGIGRNTVHERGVRNVPGECPPPLFVHAGNVRAAPLPLGIPIAPAIDRRAMQVRAFKRVELVVGKVQGRPEFVGRRERVEVRRVNEGVVTVGERKRYMLAFFFCRRDFERENREKEKQKKERSLHIFWFAIQWKQMYMMIIWRSVQRSNMDASLSMGRSALLDRDGVMMIEYGHVTMVASGCISSLATIESPDETRGSIGTQRASTRQTSRILLA